MEKNITIENLIKTYDADKTPNKDNFNKVLKVETYVPYQQKIMVADRLVRSTSIDNETGKMVLNTPIRHMFYNLTMLNLYTNVDVKLAVEGDTDEEKFAAAAQRSKDYDDLNSRGIFEHVLMRIPKREYSEMNAIIDMTMQDFLANKGSIQSVIHDTLEQLKVIVEAFGNVNLDQLKELIQDTGDTDEVQS